MMTLWFFLHKLFNVSVAPVMLVVFPFVSLSIPVQTLPWGSGVPVHHSYEKPSGVLAGSALPQLAGTRERIPAQAQGSAASPNFQFTHLTVADGLSNSDVRAITQDRQGFMWFGTWLGGLNRYDGYTFKVYKHDPQDKRSLASDSIWALYVDRAGVLWVGLAGGGLDRYDRETDSFIHYQHRDGDPTSIPQDNVHEIYEDETGTLWVGTFQGGGLSRFDRTGGKFFTYRPGPNNPGSFGQASVSTIALDSTTGLLWVGTLTQGVNVLDRSTGRFTRYVNDPNDPTSLSNNSVQDIFQDRAGTLWISTGGGLDRFDPRSRKFIRYHNDPQNPNSLSDDGVSGTYEDRVGRFWVATNKGLNLMDRAHATFTHYLNDPNNPNSLSGDNLTKLYGGSTGDLWIGTLGDVDRLAGEADKFVTYRHNPRDPKSLGGNTVTGLFAGSAGELWIGTEASLDRFDGTTFIHYTNNPRDPGSLNSGPSRFVTQDAHGSVWTSTYGSGLSRLDGQHFTHFRHDPTNPDSLAIDNISSLVPDARGGLWIGVHGRGIDYFDGKRFVHFPADPKNPAGLPDPYVLPLLLDRHGMLWTATSAMGLVRFDTKTHQCATYLLDPNHPGSQASNWTEDIYFDGTMMWVASATGLFCFDPATGKFDRHYTDKDGLASTSVGSVIGDKQGYLWISTLRGLSRFDPQKGTFRNFDMLDGLQGNEFSHHSRARASDGRLFFGGINGFDAFYPGKLADNPNPPPVVLTDFEIFNKPVKVGGEASPLRQSINVARSITLSHDQSVFSFRFAGLNYTSPQKNQYAYRLQGFDKDWQHTDASRRFTTYTNLDPGSYTFRVKASNNDGLWNERGISLKIKILPPWWETWWFRTVAGLAVVSLLAAGYSYRMRNLRWRTVELESQVTERTQEMQAAKEQADAANRAKSTFLANMSHELRTPLNAILGYTDILKQRSSDARPLVDGLDIIKLDIIERSGKHLLTLINDVLDLAKIEAGKMEYIPAPFHLPMFLRQIIDIIRARATAKGLSLTYEIPSSLPDMVIADEKRLRQVLLNLLGNAINFTDQGHIALRVIASDENGRQEDETPEKTHPDPSSFVLLTFEVEDTGIGIAPDQLTSVFQPFEQASETERRAEGAGLGLAISQQIVQLMGSRLQVKSEPGRGSTFWFEVYLPVTQPHAPKQPTPSRHIVGYEGSRQRVLVVDDKEYNRQLLVDMLQPLGFEVCTAEDGQQAVETAQMWHPRVVLMDLVMPVKTGLVAVREIRRQPPREDLVIIAVSASVLEADERKSQLAGCDAFLRKPVEMDQLLDVLEAHLNLTWICAQPRERRQKIPAPFIAPPQDELMRLHQLAQSGRIVDIQSHVNRLASSNEAYLPFADRLRELAQEFELDQIATFVGQFIQMEHGAE
jgi:signal transduction histidine kinase/ligand-binding sensor domain-containing protein/DNA-binding NarL/FixJ family response regulator